MGVAVVIGNYTYCTILLENPSENTVSHLLHRNPVISLVHVHTVLTRIVTKSSFQLLTNDSFMNHPITKSTIIS